jgi:hypothetical protein
VAAFDQLDQLVEDGARLADMLGRAVQRQLVAAQGNRAAEPLAQRVEHAVADPGKLRGHLVRDFEHLLHRTQSRRRLRRTRPPLA